MKQLTIDRSKWGCQDKHWELSPCLLDNVTDRMCCLGFAGKDCKQELTTVLPVGRRWGAPSVTRNGTASQFSLKAAEINDSDLPVKQKEKDLTELFKENGIKLIFNGKL